MTSISIVDCDLGPPLRAALTLRGWTQAQLAARVGVSQGAISELLRRGWGQRETIQRICAVLGVDLGATIAREAPPHDAATTQ